MSSSTGKNKILVTGAAGMLAESLVPTFQRMNYEVLPTDLDASNPKYVSLDVRDFSAIDRIVRNDFRPDLILHLAAETDVDKCESDPDHAFRTNTLGTQNVALICRKLEIPMVYVSTAGVFDGEKNEPYTEFDEAKPINAYGSSKLAGETYVRELVDEYFIVRAGWMVGGGYKDKKFVRKILDQIRHGATRIHVVTDKFGTPTYAPAFSKTLVKLVRTELFGIYHMVCKGKGSRFDVAKELLDIIGRKDVDLVPVTSEYFSKEYPAPRPRSEILRNYVLELRNMDDMPTWKDALREYLSTYHRELVGPQV